MAGGKSSVPILDYIVFVAVLLISLLIGIVFSCRQRTSEEYVHGSRSIGLVPVSVSLVVSFISAITLQGNPAEIYLYGLDYACTLVSPVGILIVMFTFLPIYYDKKYSSIFQYLEDRFQSNKLKILANVLSLIAGVMYAGIAIFGPATAIETLTGIPTIYNIVAMAAVCTIYTSLGGIRAVIWVDVFQAVIMIAGLLTILIIGTSYVGVSSIWHELERRGHTTLNFSPDITQRGSAWVFSISGIALEFQILINQSAMVRYTSLPTIGKAKISLMLTALGFFVLSLLSILVGVVVFAYYSQLGCGPLSSGEIYSPNQILPHFVVDVINIPGISGIFLAAIVASSLSSVSSVQNSFATILWKDILSSILPEMSEFKNTVLLKILSMICGIISMAISIAAMYLGGTLALASSMVMGVVAAPLFGIFIIGGSCNFVSGFSAFAGWCCSVFFCLWLSVGKLIYGTLWEKPSLINDSCGMEDPNNATDYRNWTTHITEGYTQVYSAYTGNVTSIYEEGNGPPLSLLKFYSITPFALTVIGSGITIVVALLLSAIPCFRQKQHVDPKLLFPFVRRFVKKSDEEEFIADETSEKHQALLMT